MSAPTAKAQLPAHIAMFQILNGVQITGAVACLAQLGIPDLVESGPKSAKELAAKIGADAEALYRLMRATACVGVLSEGPDGEFSETPLSAVLRTNGKPSMRSFAMMTGREWHGRGWADLEYCVRTGKQAPEHIYGLPAFEYLKQNPAEGAIFDGAMTSLSSIDSPAVVDACSFDGINSIMDVAGGHGLLLATILAKNPKMRGILFDMPHVLKGAVHGPLQSMMNRCEFASGDMFSSIPGGADAYIMKHIIHDWPDEDCVKILKSCRKGVNPNGKLLVVDAVIQSGNDFSPGKFLDVQMLIFVGGKERTETQFADLFAASDWRLNRIIPTAAVECVIEGVPA